MTALCSPSRTPDLHLTLETVNVTSSYSTYTRLLDSSTPSLRKSASRASPAERHFAFDTACQCVEEALQSKGPDLPHAWYFRAEGFRVLRDTLQNDGPEGSYQTSDSPSVASVEEEAIGSSLGDLQLRDTASSDSHRKKPGIWTKIKRRLSTESPGQQGTGDSPARSPHVNTSPPLPGSGKHQLRPSQEEAGYSFVSINVEKTFALLVSAAPLKGEVQHWVWLLRVYMDKCCIKSIHVMLSYVAKVAKYIAPEEEWLRLLVLELTPVLGLMRDNDLPTSSQAVLRAVADRAMQVSDEAVLTFRSHRSSRLQNASLLAAAVRLQALVAKCASGADCTDMAGLFEELLTSAAQQRFRSLLSKQAAATGMTSPTAGPAGSKDAAARMVASMAAVCEQLVQDICDDEECYQTAFPPECRINLPAISCRVYCSLLRTELGPLLQQTLDTDRRFFALFGAVCQLEQVTLRWAPGTLGPERCLCSTEGRLLFLPHIEAWVRGVRTKLMQWSMRLLKEEVWQHAAAGSITGLRCSPSLVELFRALCAVAEDNASVLAAHPWYASLMERTLSKVVLVHVAGLERLCQGEMPARAHQKLASQLRSLGSRSSEAQPRTPFQPSSTLYMLLNDLREIRSKQADLSNALRASLPAEWWGRPAGGGRGKNLRLGDRFKLCQVEIERRYAAVLHHVVKRMMEAVGSLLSHLLALPPSDVDASISERAQPVTDWLDEQLGRLAPLLDARVLRRVARELWNSFAGVLYDDLVEGEERGRGEGERRREGGKVYESLGNVAPRIQHVDALLKHLSQHILEHRLTGLTPEDEPEKVTKLGKMLALFMREDEGKSIESL